MENLLFSKQPDGNYRTFVVTYYISPEQVEILLGGEYIELTNFTDFQTVEEFNFNDVDLNGSGRGIIGRSVETNPNGTYNIRTCTEGPFGFPVTQEQRGVPCPIGPNGDSGSGGGSDDCDDRPDNPEPDGPIDPTGTPVEDPNPNEDPTGSGGGGSNGGDDNPCFDCDAYGTTPVLDVPASTYVADRLGYASISAESFLVKG